jgi:YggT family protein
MNTFDPIAFILQSFTTFLQIYSFLLIARILLSWFQTQEWAFNIISFLSPITDPYLNIFRSFIPPLGGLDLSPILAILALNLLQSFLVGLARSSIALGF